MEQTAEVVIIGAGVIGCSTAYHLAKIGIKDVVVLEMEQVGSGSSSRSASMLSVQFGRDPLLARMAQYSYKRYMDFETEFGSPIGFHKTGWLSVAAGDAAVSLKHHAETLTSLNIATELLTPEEIKYRYPELNTEDIELGTFGPDDGSFDPHLIMWGFAKKAREMGVKIYQDEKALGLRIEKGQVTGVKTASGFIATQKIINAAGPWAAEIGHWAGIEIPLTNKSRTIVMTGPLPDIPADRPFVEDENVEWYFRPETGGVLMGMGNSPTQSPEAVLDNEMVKNIIEYAIHRVPVLEKASLHTSWSGVRPLTADGYPIFGRVSGVDGLLLNCGWGGMGIIQAPVAGQLMAELVWNGKTSTFETEDIQLLRFAT